MELHDLGVFARVAEERSFSRAAAALHLAQPSVSGRIADLEAELGVRLFAHSSRGVILTEAGRALLPYARRCLELVAEGREAARGAGGTPRLDIAAPSSLASHLFTPVLAELADSQVEVYCHTAHTSEIKQMLLDGIVHAGFLVAGPVQSGLRLEVLARDPIVCVVAAGHPLAEHQQLGLSDIARHRVAPYSWGPDCDALIGLLREHGMPAPHLRKVSPAATARSLVLEHGYVSFLPRLTVVGDLVAGALVRLSVSDVPDWTCDIGVAYREQRARDGALVIFLEAVHRIRWGT
jgi:DNA-binding transcriptional LysR family regulator